MESGQDHVVHNNSRVDDEVTIAGRYNSTSAASYDVDNAMTILR